MSARRPRSPGPFRDHYLTLALQANASAREIRAAFKQLMLEAHPDKNPHRLAWAEQRVRELNDAFEVLGDERRRAHFDALRAATLTARKRRQPVARRYSEPYYFRREDPESRALRVLYHLTHRKPRQAVALLDELELEFGPSFLRVHLDRADYLDTLFLLAEHYSSRRRYLQAAVRLRELCLAEDGQRYQRPYLPEVLRLLKDLYLRKIPGTSGKREAVEALIAAQSMRLTRTEEKTRLEKLAKLQMETGDLEAARRSVQAAEQLLPLSKNLERIRKRIKSAG